MSPVDNTLFSTFKHLGVTKCRNPETCYSHCHLHDTFYNTFLLLSTFAASNGISMTVPLTLAADWRAELEILLAELAYIVETKQLSNRNRHMVSRPLGAHLTFFLIILL